MKTKRGFLRLVFSQAQVAFNDNAVKLVLIGLVQMILSPEHAARTVSLLALLLTLPFVLFAPLAGWICDRFPKRDVVLACLGGQVLIMGVLLASILLRWVDGVLFGFFLLGTQAAIFSPAKRGLVKELVPASGIGSAVGLMEMLSIVSILIGSVAGGRMIDLLTTFEKGPWNGAWTAMLILTTTCSAAFLSMWGVPCRKASGDLPDFKLKILTGHFSLLGGLYRQQGLFRAALGDAAFYFMGGILTLTLAQVGRQVFGGGVGTATATGIMLALIGAGVACGSALTANACRRTIRLGLVPIGALGMSALLLALSLCPFYSIGSKICLFALGVFAGLYLIPLDAWLVDRSPERHRGEILSASGLLSSMAGILAVGAYWMLSECLHFSVSMQLGALALFALFIAVCSLEILPDEFLRTIVLGLAGLHYKVQAKNEQRLPKAGGALIVCNHVTYVDAIALCKASPRPIRFISDEGLFSVPVIGASLRLFKCVPVSPTHAKSAIKKTIDAIRAGELVCIFPEGKLTKDGELDELKPGFELLARMAQCPIFVARLDGLWGSIFSFEGNRYFTKMPKAWIRRVVVSFSHPIGHGEATIALVRKTLLAMKQKTESTGAGDMEMACSKIGAFDS